MCRLLHFYWRSGPFRNMSSISNGMQDHLYRVLIGLFNFFHWSRLFFKLNSLCGSLHCATAGVVWRKGDGNSQKKKKKKAYSVGGSTHVPRKLPSCRGITDRLYYTGKWVHLRILNFVVLRCWKRSCVSVHLHVPAPGTNTYHKERYDVRML